MPTDKSAYAAVEQMLLFNFLWVNALLAANTEEIKKISQPLFNCAKAVGEAAERVLPEDETNGFWNDLRAAVKAFSPYDMSALIELSPRILGFTEALEKRIAPKRFVIPTGNDVKLLGERFNDDGVSPFNFSGAQREAIKKFRGEYMGGAYETESPDCVCGGGEFTEIAYKDRYSLPVTTAVCKKCGLVMTRPRMTQKCYDDFYANSYRIIYGGSSTADDAFFDAQRNHGGVILQIVGRQIPPNSRVLEIGCGAGGILMPFKEAGHDVLGIDLGDGFLEYGRGKGLNLLNVHSGELLGGHRAGFDLIILSHVAEHFLDIPAEFAVIRELLKEGGKLYVEVPGVKNLKNYGYDYMRYFQNAHTYHFSRDTLRQTLALCGFYMLFGDEQAFGVFEKDTPPPPPVRTAKTSKAITKTLWILYLPPKSTDNS